MKCTIFIFGSDVLKDQGRLHHLKEEASASRGYPIATARHERTLALGYPTYVDLGMEE